MKEKDLDRDTIVAYHAYLQHKVHGNLNDVDMGPGYLPCRVAFGLAIFGLMSLLVGVLLICLRMRHVYLVDWGAQFLGPFFIILFLICMSGATYLLIYAKRQSNKYRRECYFRPLGDYGVAVVHKSTIVHDQEVKSELKSGTTPHKTYLPQSSHYSNYANGRPRKSRDHRGYDNRGYDADRRRPPEDRHRRPPPDDRRRRPPPDDRYRDDRPRGERRPRPDDRPRGPDDRPRRPDDRPRGPDDRPRRPDDRPRRPDERRRPPPPSDPDSSFSDVRQYRDRPYEPSEDSYRSDMRKPPPPGFRYEHSEDGSVSEGPPPPRGPPSQSSPRVEGRRPRGKPKLHTPDQGAKLNLDPSFGQEGRESESEL